MSAAGGPAAEVLAAGMQTTVQDLGRPGFGPLGVSAAGAADAVALRLANRLLGNSEGGEGMAALEMTLTGATLRFERDTEVAVTGAPWPVLLDGNPAPSWQALRIRAGQTLAVGSGPTGARAYLAVAGGIAVPRVFGSASTHLQSGLGGFAGRALVRGDRLEFGAAEDAGAATTKTGGGRRVKPEVLENLAPRKTLRVVSGADRDRFSQAAWAALLASAYRVSERSNRMGIRLEGPPVRSAAEVAGPPAPELLTEGVPLGAVQVPPDGQPIVLFVEHQTTGGYPKIANVISADLASVGQLRPREEIRFVEVSLGEARAALFALASLLRSPDIFQT